MLNVFSQADPLMGVVSRLPYPISPAFPSGPGFFLILGCKTALSASHDILSVRKEITIVETLILKGLEGASIMSLQVLSLSLQHHMGLCLSFVKEQEAKLPSQSLESA